MTRGERVRGGPRLAEELGDRNRCSSGSGFAAELSAIHQDTLEYTSEGLQTTRDLDLHVGAVNRVVIERPRPVEAIPIGYGAYATDSSFPTLSVLMLGFRHTFETPSANPPARTSGSMPPPTSPSWSTWPRPSAPSTRSPSARAATVSSPPAVAWS